MDKLKLKNNQYLAIANIISSASIEEASRKTGISKTTIYYWLKDEVFKNELKRQREEVINASMQRLKYAMIKAVEGLIELMDEEGPELKRLVYKDILNFAFRSHEIEKIEERLDKIEEKVMLQDNGRK
ncbi:MAG: hypothetical protein HQL25_01580 [Candidatus Omnitrophica bacterium]|nr:hypothetical protein [Candidatus Omnitrophota bacterium]